MYYKTPCAVIIALSTQVWDALRPLLTKRSIDQILKAAIACTSSSQTVIGKTDWKRGPIPDWI